MLVLSQRDAEAEQGRAIEPGSMPCSTVHSVSESLKLTIIYEHGEDDWIVASIPEVSGAHSQGRTREEARANVIDALRGILELRFGDHGSIGPGVDHESLDLVIAA